MEVIINGVEYAPVSPQPTDKSLLAALELRFDSDFGENITIRDYLREVLSTLMWQGANFNAKRPHGDSGWIHLLYACLIKGGYLEGVLDEETGYPDDYDSTLARDLVQDLIEAAFHGVATEHEQPQSVSLVILRLSRGCHVISAQSSREKANQLCAGLNFHHNTAFPLEEGPYFVEEMTIGLVESKKDVPAPDARS